NLWKTGLPGPTGQGARRAAGRRRARPRPGRIGRPGPSRGRSAGNGLGPRRKRRGPRVVGEQPRVALFREVARGEATAQLVLGSQVKELAHLVRADLNARRALVAAPLIEVERGARRALLLERARDDRAVLDRHRGALGHE